jgi:hypothetical protein
MPAKQASWYIAYRAANGTAMKITGSRDEAIEAACAMLGQEVDVQTVGPMIELPDGKVIGPTEIRKLRTMHLAA